MTTPKLTKAQMELLREIENGPEFFCDNGSKPALALVEMGLAEWRGASGNLLRITTKGRTLTTAEETKLSQRGFKSEGGVMKPI